ncbi:epidermal growth factor receptor substrate 15-like 1 isoform X2 [Brienomyrus brachyistius]|uniref:epidermal growth factor receptor substrate 15-like 1 isoform X2 n=1 Tax=Brienomyrus brachyistius TaxID=42636 RepID=UPI0020B212E8|nr:epidermal growth factor receptor substrate 15-like 1 isoform X2 [Brienomyrus brachyistius]
MAALPSLAQLSGGNPIYENFYRQVDPRSTGRVGASEAALFLKKSKLPDRTLGQIWELADSNGNGFLDKQGFLVALRLVGRAQNGQEISLTGLELPGPPPTFTDTGSPILSSMSLGDTHWAVKPEERETFSDIFESLSPVNGLLSGTKAKPVLMKSNLPMEVLGKVWDLSDIDKDGSLDREEFAVAMYLVYRSLEHEPIPPSLPSALIPPSKRKKVGCTFPGSVCVLPSTPPPARDSLHSTPTHTSLVSVPSSPSPRPSLEPQPSISWVVPAADRGRYDDIFQKTDLDMDGLVGGHEVKEIFINSGLSQNLLAHIWSLADTRQVGKLTKEQFSLAMYLINQKVFKGLDPPQALTPDMLPPSERAAPEASLLGFLPHMGSDATRLSEMQHERLDSEGLVELTGIKDLDDVSLEIAELQREKSLLEKEVREKEEAIRHKSSEVQEMQRDLEREASGLQQLEAQKQDAQERLQEMDQQRAKLESMLADVRLKCREESHTVTSLQSQIQSQEADIQSQEVELGEARAELGRLQHEETQLEQSVRAGRTRLDAVTRSLKATQEEISQARSKLSQIQASQEEVKRTIEEYGSILIGTGSINLTDAFPPGDALEPLRTKASLFPAPSPELTSDPFPTEDPFRSDPFKDTFSGDPFKGSDPFKTSSSDGFFERDLFSPSASFGPSSRAASVGPKPNTSDLFSSSDFADFSHMTKGLVDDPLARRQHSPARTGPPRPAPPSGELPSGGSQMLRPPPTVEMCNLSHGFARYYKQEGRVS